MTRSLILLVWMTLAVAAQPSRNDQHAAAFEVSGDSFVLIGDLRDATREPFEPGTTQLAGNSIWWRWRAPDSGTWAWNAGATRGTTVVTVLTVDTLGQWHVVAQSALRPLVGMGAFGLPGYESLGRGSFVAEVGREYWIRIDSVQLGGGFVIGGPGSSSESRPVEVAFERRAGEPPLNDQFASAAPLSLEAPVLKSILLGATTEYGEPPLHASSMGRTLWWRFDAPGSGTASLTFSGDSEPPAVAVYRKTAWDRLQPLGHSVTEFGNECARYWRARNRFTFDAAGAGTYFLQLDAIPGRDLEASFAAAFHFEPAPPNDDLAGARTLAGENWEVDASNQGATGRSEDPQVPGHDGSSSVWFKWGTGEGGLVQVTINEPTVFAEPNAEILPPAGGGGGGVVVTMMSPCGGPFQDLRPEPAFVPVIGLFHRFGSSGELPLLQYRGHGTNEIWAEIVGDETWVWLDGPEGVTGSALLRGRRTPPPANDMRENRVVLPSAAVRVTGRTAGARIEAGERLPAAVAEVSGGSAVPRRSVWWEWRAPAAGAWMLRPETGGWENCFMIYAGDKSAETEPLAWTFAAPVTFDAAAGQVFHVAVMGALGLGSNLEFRIERNAGPTLGIPVIRSGDGGARWIVPLPTGWRQSVEAEISQDLQTWIPVDADWSASAAGTELAVPWSSEARAGFLRVRVR